MITRFLWQGMTRNLRLFVLLVLAIGIVMPLLNQLLPIEKHHKIGQQRIAVNAARADLAHQVHAHAVAAEGKEGAVPKA